MAKKKTKQSEPKSRRQRRTADQRIAELEARIHALRQREAQKQAKSDPVMRLAAAALKTVEKALGAAKDASTKRSLNQARSALAECLETAGTVRPGPRSTKGRSSANYSDDLPEALLTYVRNNPGQRGEQIAAALATDSPTLRPVMKRLITEGKIETAGQRRGMTYTAV